MMSGDIGGGRQFMAAALGVGEPRPSRWRALALYGDGLLAFRQGAEEESRQRNEGALEAAWAVGDREAEALALVGLSRVALREGDYERVRSLASEARDLTRDLVPGAGAVPLHMLAEGTRLGGDFDQAAALFSESLELNRELGDQRMVGIELHNLGHVEIHRGNVDAAEELFRHCVEYHDPEDPYDAALVQLDLASLALARRDRDRAAELLGRAESITKEGEVVLDPDDALELRWLREQLG